jgi:hypothetical protein
VTLSARSEAPLDEPLVLMPLDINARYSINAKALARWSQERLSLSFTPDGSVEALFRYEGTTCSNMGHPLTFHYTVKVGRPEDGYLILDEQCVPAPGDVGHTRMCRYMSNAEHLMVAIDTEKPLLGKPLNDILFWQRPSSSAGCYCEPNSRKHKWSLVLETLHYALVQRAIEAGRKAAG